jgi:hypothetical protein
MSTSYLDIHKKRHADGLTYAEKSKSKAPRVLGRGKSKPWRSPKGKQKMDKTFKEFGEGKLHSGSKHGPIVHSQAQAEAIAIAQANKALSKNKKK